MRHNGVLRTVVALGLPVLCLGLVACGDDDDPLPLEPGPQLTLEYLGADACAECHSLIVADENKSGHPYKLNEVVNGQPPTYPFSSVPSPPAGYTWDDVLYVIGGYGWKARFVGLDGYIITAGGMNQYNLATGEWVDYHTDELKPYDCGRCHTTGFDPTGTMEGLPGIDGSWAFPGIECEECHGPGSLHANSPRTVNMTVDTRSESCGKCHNRGGVNDDIIAKGGFIRHHEQYNEMEAAGHSVLECVTCHDPHKGVRYDDPSIVNALYVDCEDCHKSAQPSIDSSPLALAGKHLAVTCEDCHMPPEGKSAVKFDTYVGDVMTHIFKINADVAAEPFTPDGALANPYVTLEFACLGCHNDKDKAWAATNAPDVHGPNFSSLRSVAPVSRPF